MLNALQLGMDRSIHARPWNRSFGPISEVILDETIRQRPTKSLHPIEQAILSGHLPQHVQERARKSVQAKPFPLQVASYANGKE